MRKLINPLTNRENISDSERFSYLTDDLDHCLYCGAPRTDLHEVFYGTANRQKSKDWGMVVPLCREHHELVHRNKKIRQGLQKWAQLRFETKFSHKMFVNVFKKNYL